jgi:hypothetical protein
MMFQPLFQTYPTMRLTQVGPESGIKTDTAGVFKTFQTLLSRIIYTVLSRVDLVP